jgi:hypothetical protein
MAEYSFCLDFFASFFIKKKRRRKQSFTPLFIEIKVKASVLILNKLKRNDNGITVLASGWLSVILLFAAGS